MNSKVEKRKAFIINVIYFLIILGVFYLFANYMLGLLMPFIVALLVAIILQKPINWISGRTKIKRSITSAFCVVFGLFVVGSLLAVLIIKIVNEFSGFFSFLMIKLEELPALFENIKDWLISVVHILPDFMQQSARQGIEAMSIDSLIESISSGFEMSWLTSPIGGVWNTAKQIPNILVAFIITIVSAFFLTSDYPRIRDFIYLQLPSGFAQKTSKIKSVMSSSVSKMFRAYLLIMCITGVEIFLGLMFLKLIGIYEGGYIIIISIATALVDILPVLGTGMILIPWAIYSLIMGSTGMGIGLLVMYGVIAVVRQIVEPKLVANQIGLPAIVTIIAMYVGLKLFGGIGLFLLPLTIIVLKLLNDEGVIHIFQTKKDTDDEDMPPEKDGVSESAEEAPPEEYGGADSN